VCAELWGKPGNQSGAIGVPQLSCERIDAGSSIAVVEAKKSKPKWLRRVNFGSDVEVHRVCFAVRLVRG
jgi:hypothetical protein